MRAFIFSVCIFCFALLCSATDLLVDKDACIPEQNGKYSSISELTFAFDFSNIDFSSCSLEETGLEMSMSRKRQIKIYKGSVSDNDVIVTIQQSRYSNDEGFEKGKNTISFTLDKEYALEPNQLYTIDVPASVFDLINTNDESLMGMSTAFSIEFYGSESTNDLICISTEPSNSEPIETLGNFSFIFNVDVMVTDGAKAFLLEEGDVIAEASMSVNNSNTTEILGDFGNVSLYKTHTYNLVIPENVVKSSDGNLPYKGLSLVYDGASFKYYSFGRISPANNSQVSYLGEITVPIKFDENYSLGRSKAPIAYLYEGDSTEPLQTINCVKRDDNVSWNLPIWNFELNPSSNYRVVIPANQVSAWYQTETGGFREVLDTSNPELILNYTTPAELVMPTPVTMASSTPADNAELSTLGDVKIGFSAFAFNDVSYNVVFTDVANNKIYLYEGESSEPIAEIEVKLIVNGENNVGIESVNTSDCVLYKGRNYRLVVPAGMFTCNLSNLAPYVKNDEYTINLIGATRTEFDVTCQITDGASMTTTVSKGSTPTFKFTAPQDWKVESVKFNGEDVELTNDEYTTPAIEEDATIEVEYAYAEEIQFMDLTTGVDTINVDGSDYTVGKDGDYVVIYNAAKGDLITVYTVGGMQMASHVADNDTVKILLPGGIYIVRINNVTFKIQH